MPPDQIAEAPAAETASVQDHGGAFVSYSLNFEDVLLNRVFGDRDRGFYIDVGAGHPRYESDTFALYERGWRGITVEPNDEFAGLHEAERPRDTLVRAVLSDGAERLVFHEVPGTGLSTCDAAAAAAYREAGRPVVTREVAATTLARLLAAVDPDHIDLLKVDAEGAEEAILDGNDWQRFRPDLVMVEATLPERPERRRTGIPAAMARRGYRAVHFDGLNDYYAAEGFELPPDFTLPPNVFDGFVPARVGNLSQALDEAATASRTAREYAMSLETGLAGLRGEFGAATAAREHEQHAWEVQAAEMRDYVRALEDERGALQTRLQAEQAGHATAIRTTEGLQARLDVTATNRDALARETADLQARLATLRTVGTRLLALHGGRAPGLYRRGRGGSFGRGVMGSVSTARPQNGPTPIAAPDGASGHGSAAPDDPLDPSVLVWLERVEAQSHATRLECDDLRAENRRLRDAVAQLRAENGALNHALLPLHAPGQGHSSEPTGVSPDVVAQLHDELGHLAWAKAHLLEKLEAETARVAAQQDELHHLAWARASLAEKLEAETARVFDQQDELHHLVLARAELTERLDAAATRIAALEQRLSATFASSSWKLTRPLRGLSRTVRGQQGADWPSSSDP